MRNNKNISNENGNARDREKRNNKLKRLRSLDRLLFESKFVEEKDDDRKLMANNLGYKSNNNSNSNKYKIPPIVLSSISHIQNQCYYERQHKNVYRNTGNNNNNNNSNNDNITMLSSDSDTSTSTSTTETTSKSSKRGVYGRQYLLCGS